MKIYSGKEIYKYESARDLRDILDRSCEKYGQLTAYTQRIEHKGDCRRMTYTQLRDDIRALGTALIREEIVKEDGSSKVSVIGENSYEWVIASNSILFGAGISVPLDRQLAAPEILSLLERAEVEAFFITLHYLDIAIEALHRVPSLKTIIVKDCDPAALVERIQSKGLSGEECACFISLERLLKSGRKIRENGDRFFEHIVINPKALSLLFFTSGTTAMAKGVMLSQYAIAQNVAMALRTVRIGAGSRALSMLPLHHIYEGAIGMYALWSVGANICFNDGLRYIAYNMKDWEINIILSVPLLLENLYKQIKLAIQKRGKQKQVDMAIRISRFLLKFGIDVRRKLFKDIYEPLGGGLQLLFAGAAPLSAEVHRFFNDIGIRAYIGYGLSETAPLLTANSDRNIEAGTAGRPLPGIEVRIEDGERNEEGHEVGEIVVRTPSIMLGYYEDPVQTAEVLSADGWFRTGDVGYFNKRGNLRITGRSKSMIVLTSGKKIFPEEIEYLLSKVTGIKNALVFGDPNDRGNIEVVAELQLEANELPNDEAERKAYIHRHIESVNAQMPKYKRIAYYVWKSSDLISTTTLKVKRAEETETVRAALRARGWTMRQADGQCID